MHIKTRDFKWKPKFTATSMRQCTL
jgi:hypothetical protein